MYIYTIIQYELVFEMNPTTGASKLHSKKVNSSKFICKIMQEFEPAGEACFINKWNSSNLLQNSKKMSEASKPY